MTEHSKTRKIAGLGVVMVVITVAVIVPPAIAVALNAGALAGSLILPVIAALIPAMLVSWRAALFATAVLVVGVTLADIANGHALFEALIMTATSLIIGLGCHWGVSKNLIMVPIGVGFIVCLDPRASEDLAANALILFVATLLAALWGLAVGWLLSHKVPQPPHTPEVWERTWPYAITLALLTGIATYISVSISWGHAGAWFILTVVIVFQPYLSDAFSRTWQRAAGTLLGVVITFAVHVLVPWSWATLAIAEILMLVAMFVMLNPKYPYWLYTTLFTPAILLLLTTTAGNFEQTTIARLVATLSGAALALVAVALLTPFYRAKAKELGLDKY